MARLELQVKLLKVIEWTQSSYVGYGTTYYSRYIFKDSNDTVYTWKTTSILCLEELDKRGNTLYINPRENDVITIKATVKGESEYNGYTQTELTRVKLVSIDVVAPTPEEIAEAKRQAQYDSLAEGDTVERMSYRRYKNHYSDCETIVGSYFSGVNKEGVKVSSPSILVILRAGRVKPSGVRGEHFSGYQLTNELDEIVVYRAVSEENALKRANKEYAGHNWECTKIYEYDKHRIF